MEISVLIQDYFKSKFRSKHSHKNVQYINPIRQEQINRINNRKFDYVISGLDLNMIALAKNILKEGKSCLLLTKEDYVKFNPNKMLSSPFTLSTFFLLARRHFNLDEHDLLKEYLSSYYENLLKLGENMEQGKMSIRLDLNYLLYHQKFYFMILNNILMYRNNFRNSYLKMDVNKVYFINKDVEYNSAIMKELTKLTLDNRGIYSTYLFKIAFN